MNNLGVSLTKIALALTCAVGMTTSYAHARVEEDSPQVQKALDKGLTVMSSEQKANGHRWIKARILIKACPHVVWDTVHEERKHDPDLAYSKVLSEEKGQETVEQKFSLIPIIGTAVCVMKDTEVPYERIEYNMVSSDHFKAMEGSWILTPGLDGNSTILELSSYCDLGIPVPRPMIDNVTSKKLQRRLSNVREMAEATQIKLAHANSKLN